MGGTCINLAATKDSTHIGYKCNCSAGYTAKFGDAFCEGESRDLITQYASNTRLARCRSMICLCYGNAEQQCRFSPNQTANARPGNCPEQQDGYILLKPVSNPTCELGCADGYAKNDAVYTCLPNNPDGSRVVNNKKGVTKGSMQCIGTWTLTRTLTPLPVRARAHSRCSHGVQLSGYGRASHMSRAHMILRAHLQVRTHTHTHTHTHAHIQN